MKQKTHYIAAFLTASLMLLSGCNAHVDLGNIDPSVKIDMGVAMPVGTFSIRLGDLLGDSSLSNISIREDGVYQYTDTFTFSKQFDDMDLLNLRGDTTEKFTLPKELAGFPIYGGQDYTIEHDLTISLEGLTNKTFHRVDSLHIASASFAYSIQQNMGLRYDCVHAVQLVMPSNITCREGAVVDLPLEGGAFGEEAVLTLHDLSICVMQDPTATPSDQNTTNKIPFQVRITFGLPEGEMLTTVAGSGFEISARANNFDVRTLYGLVSETAGLDVDSTLVLSHLWSGFEQLNKQQVSFAEPTLDLVLTTGVAVPLRCEIKHIVAENKDHSESVSASFHGSPSYSMPLPNYVSASSPLGSTATNWLRFDNENGGIGHLTAIHPEYIHYALAISRDEREGVLQHRVHLGDPMIDGMAILNLPFTMDGRAELQYTDTLDIDLSSLSLDSLLGETEVVDSIRFKDVHMVLTVSNWFPFEFGGKFRFFDENYRELQLTDKPDGVQFTVPSGPAAAEGTPGQAYFDIEGNKMNSQALNQVRHIEYTAHLLHADDGQQISLHQDARMAVKIALTTQVEAYLQLNFSSEKDKDDDYYDYY